jgi:hypothetical protein
MTFGGPHHPKLHEGIEASQVMYVAIRNRHFPLRKAHRNSAAIGEFVADEQDGRAKRGAQPLRFATFGGADIIRGFAVQTGLR